MTTNLLTPASAAQHIASGRLIAYPTEAVYGIGCDPANPDAVKAVLKLKSRDQHKGFILIAAELAQLRPYIDVLSAGDQQTLNEAWPGPVTFVCKAKPDLPELLTGGRDTIAVRVSAHPVVVELCNACGHALISTSANISGRPALTNADAVAAEFGDEISGVVDGSLGELKTATPIFSLITGEQLR